MSTNKKLTLFAFILMILTSVFGVTNIGTAFYRMGYAAIPMFIIGGLCYFLPSIFMMIELGTAFGNKSGGIYTWMKESVSIKFAFLGIMMWYCSYVVWMFGKSLSLWVPLSFALFGKDITTTPVMVGSMDFGPFILGMFGIIVLVLLYFIVSKGASKLSKVAAIGGLAVISLNIILLFGGIIAFIVNGFVFKLPLTMDALVTSPNSNYTSLLPFLGFLVFSVFAYGGTEAIVGVSEDLENSEKNLVKGVLLSAIFIIVCYILGILLVGAALNWSDFPDNVSSLSALFLIMQNLGDTIAGQSNSLLGVILTRFSGFGMFLSYFGAMIALAYAPLKQLVGGTPKEFWPKSFEKENEAGIRVDALRVQTIIVIGFITVKSVFSLFDPEGANALYELIITMTNVGMTIPYLFLIYAWYSFRKNDNLPKNRIIIKSNIMVVVAFLSAFIAVAFGNIMTIITPFIGADKNISSGVWTIIGPVLFSIIALVIYEKAKEKVKKS